jgi:hypothetical protein
MLPNVTPTEPEAVRLARIFREAINADLDAQVYQMAEKWVELENMLSGKISDLLLEIDTIQKSGGVVTDSKIRELSRYKTLRDQAYQEIKNYNGTAEKLIADKQLLYATRGVDNAASVITASYEGRIGAFFNRLPVSAVETMVGYLGDGTPLSRLLDESFPLAWKQTTDALFEGISLGLNPNQVARNMVDGLGYGLEKATVIARTEQLRAYRQATVMEYRESGVVKGFRRLVAKVGAWVACLLLDNEYYEVESEFDDHPNGRCTVIAVLKDMPERERETGTDWFKALDPEQQKSIMGGKYYEAWKDGQFKLGDMVHKTHSDTWGDAPAVVALKDLV